MCCSYVCGCRVIHWLWSTRNYTFKENLLSLLEAIKHQQLLSKGWDLTSPSSPHAERLDPIQVLCRQPQLLRAHEYSSLIQNTVSQWSFCFLSQCALSCRVRGAVQMSHPWLSTPLTLTLCSWPAVSFCTKHCPLHKETLWWGLRAALICEKYRFTGNWKLYLVK